MPATVYMIEGARYLTSTEVATRLGVAQRTVLRWAERLLRNADCPELIQQLVVRKDPLTGFVYFKEQSVNRVVPHVLRKRAVRTSS
jgi:hypothetical protein